MIKLKISGDEMSALSTFFQKCIDIAREEITWQMDYKVYQADTKSSTVQRTPWPRDQRNRFELHIAERHANISVFEDAQAKLINAFVRARSKKQQRPFSISMMAGYLLITYSPRALAMIKNDYVKMVVQCQSDIIFKNLL